MSLWHHVQRSFSGGEISPRMLMRTDHPYYKQSAMQMVNFIPTPQGSAVRAPGTRYLQDVGELKARIVPYLTTGNERSLLLFTASYPCLWMRFWPRRARIAEKSA